MTRWFRFYEDAVNDPKVQRLEPKLFKAWVNMLCIASRNDGWLPTAGDVAFTLRVTEAEAGRLVDALISCGLLDEYDGRFTPHNWNGRQYKSDVSTERVKQYRKRKRNVSPAVSETPPETEQIQKQISEANASGADAPDPRTRLFKEGLSDLAEITGKGPDACRSFVGKCLKAAEDDAGVVLGMIAEAKRNRIANPAAWIAAQLKVGGQNGRPRSAITQAADDLVRKLASFDGPPRGADELRGAEGQAPPRLLSNG